MRKALRIALWTLSVFVVLIAGAFVYLVNADLSVYDEQIEEIIGGAIGHQVDISGRLELDVGKNVVLVAEKVSVTNPNWQQDPVLLSVEHLSVSVNLWSIIRQPIFIEDLDVRGIDFRLYQDAAGKMNWSSEKPKTANSSDKGAGFDTKLFAFKEVKIEDFRFLYTNPARPRPNNAVVDQLTIKPVGDSILDLDLRGAINDFPLWADGKIGPLQSLVDGRDVTADITLSLGQLRLSINGSIEDLRKLTGIQMTAGLKGPAVERITEALGIPSFAAGAFSVSADVQKLSDGSALKLEGNFGEIDIFASGSIDQFIGPQMAKLDFHVAGPDTMHVAEVFGVKGAPEAPFQVSGDLQMDGKRFQFTSTEMRVAENVVGIDGWLDTTSRIPDGDIDVSASGPDFSVIGPFAGLAGIPAEAFAIKGKIQKTGDDWSFDTFDAAVGDNKITAHGAIGGKNGAATGIVFSASGPDNTFIQVLSGLELPPKPYKVTAHIQPDPDGIRLDDATAAFGENRLRVDGVIATGAGLVGTRLDVRASGPDFSDIGPIVGLAGIPAEAFTIKSNIQKIGDNWSLDGFDAAIGNNRLRVDGVIATGAGLVGTRLAVRASGPELADVAILADVPQLPSGAYDARADIRLAKNTLHIDKASASIADLTASASGRIGFGNGPATYDLAVSLKGPNIADVMESDVLNRLSGESFEVGGQLKSRPDGIEVNGATAVIANLTIKADGSVMTAAKTGEISLGISSPNSSVLARLSGLSNLPSGAVSVSGKIERQVGHLKFTDTEAQLGEFRFAANGLISNAPNSNKSDLTFSASGPDLNRLGLTFGVSTFPPKPFSVSGGIDGIPTGFAVDKLVARVGDNDVNAKFRIDLDDKPTITGSISSTFIDLTKPIEESEAEKKIKADKAAAAANSEFMFSSDPLPLTWMQRVNVDVSLETDRVIGNVGDFLDFKVGLKLWDGTLDIKPFSFSQSDGKFDATLKLRPSGDLFAVDMTLDFDNARLGQRAFAGQDPKTLPHFRGKVTFQSVGSSLHEVMSAANGHVSIYQGPGIVKAASAGSSILFGDITTQLLDFINPLAKKQTHSNIECGIYDVAIVHGVARTETLAMQSDRMTMMAKGRVEFDKEKLDFTVQAIPRKGFGISVGGVINSFIKIGGTLRKPQVMLDPASSTATAGVAVATAGLSLLAKSLWDRASAEKSICEKIK